jgi:hypothetical protein
MDRFGGPQDICQICFPTTQTAEDLISGRALRPESGTPIPGMTWFKRAGGLGYRVGLGDHSQSVGNSLKLHNTALTQLLAKFYALA